MLGLIKMLAGLPRQFEGLKSIFYYLYLEYLQQEY